MTPKRGSSRTTSDAARQDAAAAARASITPREEPAPEPPSVPEEAEASELRALQPVAAGEVPAPLPDSDEALMLQVMAGRREACDELYLRHATRLRAFAQRFVGRGDIADDLVQDVFLKVFRNPHAFDPRGRFVTWVFAVARNACIDWLRTKRLPTVALSPRDDDDERRADPPAPLHDPAHAPVLAELESALTEVLRSLSPKLREVFVLCSLQGMAYEEAAEIIGCPVKTVSSRLSRARDQVFEAFQHHLGDGARRHRS